MFYDVIEGNTQIRCLNLGEVQVVVSCLLRMELNIPVYVKWHKEPQNKTTLGDWGRVNPYSDPDKFSHEVATLKPIAWTKKHIEDSREYIE